MKILVTGANGQVGHELLRALLGAARDPNPHPALLATLSRRERETKMNPSPAGRGAGVRVRSSEIIPATRDGTLEAAFLDEARVAACERMDLADIDDLHTALDRIAPDLIVNAAAYTAVDRAEDEPELAMRVNADAVGAIGAWAARNSARVVHYSTDYVFDGSATRPYLEDDAPHPLGVYGRSKLAGELALRESGARRLILRTAWVYGARGHNFLRTMLRLAAERDEFRVVDDQVGAPTSARLIADTTARAVERWFDRDGETGAALDGTYHLVAAGQVSWCGFARAIFERGARLGSLERMPPLHAIRTDEYPTKAKRPAYSVLDTGKLRDAFHIDLPDWQTALDDVMEELARS
jgi:dTDP-4-dehydrorhamnose reductase